MQRRDAVDRGEPDPEAGDAAHSAARRVKLPQSSDLGRLPTQPASRIGEVLPHRWRALGS